MNEIIDLIRQDHDDIHEHLARHYAGVDEEPPELD